MGDLDVGEQFLNFCLDPALRPYCGVDLKGYFKGCCLGGVDSLHDGFETITLCVHKGTTIGY